MSTTTIPVARHRLHAMEEGTGARVRRVFPVPGLRNLDPFVVLDEFRVQAPAGFPDHPHRGFEAVTYMLEGAFHHRDNLGNDSIVGAGGAQRFTAGRGLVHSEMPEGQQPAHGLQLWINLPRAEKGIDPDYQEVLPEELPETQDGGVVVRTIIGPSSPLQLRTEVRYAELRLPPAGAYHPHLPDGLKGLVLPLGDALVVDGVEIPDGEAALFHAAPRITAPHGARAVLLAGRPHGEPIYQWGPFVD